MKYLNSILETIGSTPLIKLNSVVKDLPCLVLAKVEYFNPGNSVKDRMALQMVRDAEADGSLKPGGTIIECTSGNTGMGLALVAASLGYKCIITIQDKQSIEKVHAIRALGAEVIVCPTQVAPDDPKSFYSVARQIHETTPNSIFTNQYDNPSNSVAHYKTTGPEIWEQTDGKVTHYFAGIGTGGTLSGVGKYLKEKNKEVQVVGVDPYGSILKKYHTTGEIDMNELSPYLVEGIGEDIIPSNLHISLVDDMVQVDDKNSAQMTRRLAREEGLFVGFSSGTALSAVVKYAKEHGFKKDDVVVVVLPDHGSRYMGKIYNDEWMKEHKLF